MNRFRVLALLLVLISSLVLVVVTLAQSSTNYDLTWNVMGSGGGRMDSANYMMDGTLNQSFAGYTQSANYLLSQGYWIQTRHRIYLPAITKD